MNVEDAQYLKLHYHLKQHGHTMDARLLNKAESEFLKISLGISEHLELKVKINSLPKKEGGLESFFEIIVIGNSALGGFIGTIIGSVISDVIADWIKTDSKLEELKKENLQIENEILKKKLAELEDKNEGNPELIEILKQLAIILAENNKVKIAKSNFYKNLKADTRVVRFGTQRVDRNLAAISRENVVPREDFSKFIIEELDVEPDYLEQVPIEIISPVLDNSRKHWRGGYNDIVFNFAMKDRDFQNMVVQRNLKFSNGTYIIADLEIRQRIDHEGELKVKGRDVYSVSQIIYPEGDKIDIIHDKKDDKIY